jgi:hypothetical protein
MRRLRAAMPMSSSNPRTTILAFITCLILAQKCLDDHRFANKTWSSLLGLQDVGELNAMEARVLGRLGYALFVSPTEYAQWSEACQRVAWDLELAALRGTTPSLGVGPPPGNRKESEFKWTRDDVSEGPQVPMTPAVPLITARTSANLLNPELLAHIMQANGLTLMPNRQPVQQAFPAHNARFLPHIPANMAVAGGDGSIATLGQLCPISNNVARRISSVLRPVMPLPRLPVNLNAFPNYPATMAHPMTWWMPTTLHPKPVVSMAGQFTTLPSFVSPLSAWNVHSSQVATTSAPVVMMHGA